MKVTLKAYTQPVDDADISDMQEFIAFCARVSNPSNQYNTETSDRLLTYLIKHKHWSPMEIADAVLEIECTRDIGRQILRHRSFSFQEFSQRYADPTKDMIFVYREARLQDLKNRQNSISVNDPRLESEWQDKQQEVINAARDAYRWAIENGIAKEQARCVLPEGNTMSRMYMKGSIRSWIHYIDIRTGEETQLEHRLIAKACAEAISKIFPMVNDFKH